LIYSAIYASEQYFWQFLARNFKIPKMACIKLTKTTAACKISVFQLLKERI
jgi:hypothetical protein